MKLNKTFINKKLNIIYRELDADNKPFLYNLEATTDSHVEFDVDVSLNPMKR